MPDANDPSSDLFRRGARGALALGLRQLLVQALSAAATVVLARLLGAAEFGVFGITIFLMHVLVVAGDAGLAAALVREDREPGVLDYQAVFTFQQVATLAVASAGTAILVLVPALLPNGSALGLLIPAALCALVLTSFQTTPVAMLERHLGFDRLAVVEVAQALAFNGVAVAGALAGYGANAFALALMARASAGVLVVRRMAPSPASWRWDWERVRPRLRFGLAFQASTAVNLVRESLVPVYVGATLGSAAVGQVFFAQLLAAHVMTIAYMLQRVLMPLFARLQLREEELRRAVESSHFAVAVLVVPVQTTALVLADPLVRIVFGEQWLPVLPLFYILWVAQMLEPQLVVSVALMNALGRSERTLGMSVQLMVLSWIVGVLLLHWFGIVGFGVASLVLMSVKGRLLVEADDAIGTGSARIVLPVWIAGLASAAATSYAVERSFPVHVFDLAWLAALALTVYATLLAMFCFARIRAAAGLLSAQVQP